MSPGMVPRLYTDLGFIGIYVSSWLTTSIFLFSFYKMGLEIIKTNFKMQNEMTHRASSHRLSTDDMGQLLIGCRQMTKP